MARRMGKTKERILESLKAGKRNCTELTRELGLSQSTVCSHLAELVKQQQIERVPNEHFRRFKYYRLVQGGS